MKTICGLVVVALAAGCGTEMPATGETQQAITRCDDPESCVHSNGDGVYTQELGNAGIGPTNFMITRFFNYGTGIYVLGRYYDSSTNDYVQGSAQIKTARVVNALAGVPVGNYGIVSVSETGTNPTFGLSGGVSVSGPALQYFEIVLQLPDGSLYTVSFNPPSYNTTPPNPPSRSRRTTGTGVVITEQVFPMRWNVGATKTATTSSYCTLAPDGTPPVADDNVVFQQGIVVNALTADMNSNSAYVTLSCQFGAIARAALWGYVYNGTQDQADMFEAVMHMKRASYCGNDTFFTRRATEFFIRDSAGINNDSGAITLGGDQDFEASWGWTSSGIRALCVNTLNRRHPNALYLPPNWQGGPHVEFDDVNGDCHNGTPDIPLDNCAMAPSVDPNHPWWVADQAASSP